jgi:hypothetical protein
MTGGRAGDGPCPKGNASDRSRSFTLAQSSTWWSVRPLAISEPTNSHTSPRCVLYLRYRVHGREHRAKCALRFFVRPQWTASSFPT